MNKTKLLTAAVIVLFLLNIGIISFLLMNKPPRPGGRDGEGPKRIIIERLRLDKEQIDQYDQLIKEHQQSIRTLSNEIVSIKNQLYRSLSSSDTLLEDSLVNRLGEVQQQIEHAHIRHFIGIRKLCRPEQLPDYELLTRDLGEYFAPKGAGSK